MCPLRDLPETDNSLYSELLTFFNRIDKVTLVAFDTYLECREKLFEIKVQTAKNQVSGILRRSDLVSEVSEWQPAENE